MGLVETEMQGPDYRTAAEYFADKARQEKWERTHGEWAPGLPPPMIDGRLIHTEHVYPPIPDRSYDWSATLDGYEPGDPIGRGRTAKEAIEDLKEKMGE